MSLPSDFYPTFVDSVPVFDESSGRGLMFLENPHAFLVDYFKRGLSAPHFNSPEEQRRDIERLYIEDPRPSFTVDPRKLDLREFRKPNLLVDPGEPLERDRFLKSMYSPLT